MRAVFCCVAFAAAFSAGAVAAAERVDSIAAVVNGDVVTRGEVRREAVFLARRAALGEEDAVTGDGAERRALEVLIERRLQLQEARRWGIAVSDSLLARRRAEARERTGAASDTELNEWARLRWGLSAAEYGRRLREDLAMEALFYRRVYLAEEVGAAEVDEFLQNESGLFMGVRYRLRHILAAGGEGESGEAGEAARRRAEELRAEIVGGADFAGVAERESDGEFAARGGDLGWRRETDLPEIFLSAARTLTVGGISGALPSRRGFHLLRLEERQIGPGEKAEQVRISHLFLPGTEGEKARELRRRIAAGDDFAELVRAHTIDERSAERGGDLGWFAGDNLPGYFAPAVARLGEGEISDPVESPFGWHLLRLDKRETRRLDLAALRDRAARLLREQRALAKRGEWLRGLRARAYISIRAPELAADTEDGFGVGDGDGDGSDDGDDDGKTKNGG